MALKRGLKRPDRPVGAVRLLVLVVGAIGAGGTLAQTVTVTPSVQTRLTWTDNVGASSDKESDWIAELAPGINISRQSGRVSGLLNAQLRNVGYANDTGRNTSYLALQGSGQVEAIENLFFVDVDANISRSNLSAFSGRSGNDDLNVDEDNETRSWSIGPRLEFRLGASTQGSIRYLSRWLQSGGNAISNQRFDEWAAQASSPTATRVFGWGLDFRRSSTEYDDSISRNVTEEIGRATLFINVTPQFRLRAIGGHESNDYANSSGESGTIYGGGVDWNPTERTAFSGTMEERVFGTGYDLSFKHRAARSTWDLSYVKDFSSSAQTLGGGIYQDPLFLTFFNDPNLVAALPDSAQREAFVRLLLGYPATGGTGAIVSNAQQLSETFRAGFSVIGVRNTLSFSLQQSDSSRLSDISGLSAQDDFALSDTVKTTSATVSLSHKLSGTSSLNTAVTRSRSEGASGTGLDTKRLFATVGLTTKIGPKTNAGLTYRYQRSDGSNAGSDFTENAITANLGMTF